jgi:hypothetical protein
MQIGSVYVIRSRDVEYEIEHEQAQIGYVAVSHVMGKEDPKTLQF